MCLGIIDDMARKKREKNGNTDGFRQLLKCMVAVFFLYYGMRLWSCERSNDLSPYPDVNLDEMEELDLARHAYDWDRLQWNDSFVSYEDERYTSLQGIDVSQHQKEIDWQKVAQSGIKFAFIRVGYRGTSLGNVYPDKYFEANIKGALENGIEVGIYFFSQAITTQEAAQEAQYVIDHIQGYDVTYPVVFDMEDPEDGSLGRAESLDRQAQTEIALTFLACIEEAGYQGMLYDSSMLFSQDYMLGYLETTRLWVADYASYPKYPYVFEIWQYSSKGQVDGIEGNCDMDIRFVPR